MSDAGKIASVRADVAAALAPLQSLDAPYKVAEIVETLDATDLTTWDAIGMPAVGIAGIRSVGPDKRISIGSGRTASTLTIDLFVIATDVQGPMFARPVIERLYEYIRTAPCGLHYRRSPIGDGGRRYVKLREHDPRPVKPKDRSYLAGPVQYTLVILTGDPS